ncbi:MAG: hypothetical protein OEY59_07060 [Deltaproteobacteria bacterium]|nr:hypothetical protein [Deltaproteobacteria bacterium]
MCQKIRVIKKITLPWSVIGNLYASVIGKCLFILSSVAIVTTIPYAIEIISTRNVAIALIGAILITVSYTLYKIIIPETINEFTDKSYYEHLVELQGKNSLDRISEFSILENNHVVNSLPVFSNKNLDIQHYENIKNYITVLGDDRTLYILSIIKYSLLNYSLFEVRALISIMFYSGICLIYYPSIYRIIYVIIKGVS